MGCSQQQSWNSAVVRRKVLAVKFASIIIAVFILAALTSAQTEVTTASAQQEGNVREAVLRYQISSWKLSAASYCVEINGKDADKDFLERLRPLPVKKASACENQRVPKLPRSFGLYSLVDRKTKKQAVRFDMGEIRFTDSAHATVQGGYYCGSQCMASGTYRLESDGVENGWRVTSFDIAMQS